MSLEYDLVSSPIANVYHIDPIAYQVTHLQRQAKVMERRTALVVIHTSNGSFKSHGKHANSDTRNKEAYRARS